ncbi:MAG: hypothetical protein QF819_02585 [Gemmatimonadota bacterium]|jgi:hypothetical protein|nr:hypothetical protein [Gemmatimonadota bacterium]MDP6461989.1 hypothetical protein [Gemmatimonadota bacterium]MDP6528954.1 hypothetical protein [Gemmatimonadota bacterium]MDP6802048.1 hypothetical protein [Gemmatimonadota bacterium]MDP7031396.1 hypothetical protein [Gemmatimonadota bacterium]
MSVAPEPQRSACLEVLSRAILEARATAHRGQEKGLSAGESARLADLMEAVHNIPALLNRWEECDEAWLTEGLRVYDSAWAEGGGPSLIAAWEKYGLDATAGARSFQQAAKTTEAAGSPSHRARGDS